MSNVGSIAKGLEHYGPVSWSQIIMIALNVDKSPGPDGVHPKLLRSLAADPSFVNAVYTLFLKCATDRKIPDDWKMANVVALHKVTRQVHVIRLKTSDLSR